MRTTQTIIHRYRMSLSLRNRRRWYADEDGGEEQKPPAAAPDKDDKKDGDKTISQAELSSRLKRERNKVAKELGFESYEDMQRKRNAPPPAPEQKPEANTELDEMKRQIAELTAKNEASEKAALEAQQQRRTDATKKAIEDAVNGLRLKPTAAKLIYGWVVAEKKDVSKLLGDDLKANSGAMNALIAEARTEFPELFKPATPGSPSNFGGTPADVDKKAKEAAARAQAARTKAIM